MGVALLWKPRGVNSQAALHQLKRELLGDDRVNRRDIGHTGTLDPFAEGLLLCGWGEGTKLLAPLTGLPKTYEARIVFGATSDTLDDTSDLNFPNQSSRLLIALPELAAQLAERGPAFLAAQVKRFAQVPPLVSAVHIDGKRGYEWARLGEQKTIAPREVEILSAEALGEPVLISSNAQGPLLRWTVRLKVSAGTYIRALARDWGQELCGWPGHLDRLVRTGIGDFAFPDPLRAASEGSAPLSLPSSHGPSDEAENPRILTHPLRVSDLAHEFELLPVTDQVALELLSFGRWPVSPRARPALLLNSAGQTLAYLQAGTGKIGRVLRSCGVTS